MLYYIGRTANYHFAPDVIKSDVRFLIYDTDDLTLESISIADVYRSGLNVEGLDFVKTSDVTVLLNARRLWDTLFNDNIIVCNDTVFAASQLYGIAYYARGDRYWRVGFYNTCDKVVSLSVNEVILPVNNSLCVVDIDSESVRKLRLTGGNSCNVDSMKRKVLLGCSVEDVFK